MAVDTQLSFNLQAQVTQLSVGELSTPIVIIDDVLANPQGLLQRAAKVVFRSEPRDFYPGQRAAIGCQYIEKLAENYLPLFSELYGFSQSALPEVILSAFSLTTTPERQLKPIQMLPHFDNTTDTQLAAVHYLCDDKHGGTGFFRHKSTGIERVTEHNLKQYGQTLKQQAIDAKLHQQPQYVGEQHELFTSIGSVDAKFNRLVIYPSNLLHSGLIKTATDLRQDPTQGRLTTSSFIAFQRGLIAAAS